LSIGYQLTTALGANELHFAKLIAKDKLSEPFRYEFHMLTRVTDLDFKSQLGAPLSLEMDMGNAGKRYFSGVCTKISHVGPSSSYEHYVAIVRPNLWTLRQSADCRIFQNRSIPDVIKAVLAEGDVSIDDRLTESYPQVEYCVQYRESDFDFVNRLMEEVGIYYFFTHSADRHEMVLVDSGSAHEAIPGTNPVVYQRSGVGSRDADHIWNFEPAGAVVSGSVVLTDYDFEKPRASLETRSQFLASYSFEQGEVYDYPGKYIDTKIGQNYSLLRREALQVDERMCSGEGNPPGLATGGLFTLSAFPIEEFNCEYLVVESEIEMTSQDARFDLAGDGEAGTDQERRGFKVRFNVMPSSVPFRSVRKTPRPIIGGPHTAVVVGKEGEEIWTDEYGRIKVQFHWDRLGKKDENSTCWLRVLQSWAGTQWGSIFIPRIGQEVMVQFLEGDPDRPVVTGCLYNADMMPPYGLPANMTQSGIKTRSTKDGTAENFNELRFEDKKGEEEIYLHAERDFSRVVENNDTLKVGFDKKEDGNQTIDIYNNRTVTLDQGSDTLQVKKGDRTVLIDTGNSSLTIGTGNRTEDVKGNDSLTVRDGNHTTTVESGNDALVVSQGDHSVNVSAGKSTIEAATSIELKVGGSSIKITPDSITLTAMSIEITGSTGASVDGGLKVEVKGVTATLSGQATAKVVGGVVMIN
jgi:type VI secretion system secreted protein VgrG